MKTWIKKEHDRDILLARTQNSTVSEHANGTGHKPLWNEKKFIDRDNHWYTWKVKEAIHIRLNPNNINRDNGAEIPEAWMPTIRKHQSQRLCRETTEQIYIIIFFTCVIVINSSRTGGVKPAWHYIQCCHWELFRCLEARKKYSH